MEAKDVKEALSLLRKEKKRKFNQSVDLIVNLKDLDIRKEALNTFVTLPNPSEKKIAAFLTRKSKVVFTITEQDFIKYNNNRDIKRLAKSYDFFIAVAPMMSKVASKFGRILGPLNKMPSPQAGIITKDDDETVQKMVDIMKSLVRIRNKELSIKISIGKEDMPDEKIIENVESVLNQLISKLPKGNINIKNVMIKFSMTPSIKFFDNTSKKDEKK